MSEWGETRPAYLRIADAIRDQIDSGRIAPDEQIPSVHQIMADHGVANATALKAVRALKATGLVETRPGVGVFVRRRQQMLSRSASYLAPPPEGERVRYPDKTNVVEVFEAVPPDDIAESLGLEVDEPAIVRRRQMTIDDQTVELVTSWYPRSVAQGTALESPARLRGGSPAELRRLGFDPHHCTEMVTTRMPTSSEARTLSLGAGVPVLRVQRTVFTEDGRPVEAIEMIMPGDRYQLFYELPVHN